MTQGALSIIVSELLSDLAGSMGYDAEEMSIPVSLQRIASGWAWSLTVVFFVVPVAIDLSGLWAFLPIKEAMLIGGAGVTLFLAAFSWAVAGPRPPVRREVDRRLLGFAGATLVWLAAAPVLTASNPQLHLLGAARLLATASLGALAAEAVLWGGDRWRVRFFVAFAAAGSAIAVIASSE